MVCDVIRCVRKEIAASLRSSQWRGAERGGLSVFVVEESDQLFGDVVSGECEDVVYF